MRPDFYSSYRFHFDFCENAGKRPHVHIAYDIKNSSNNCSNNIVKHFNHRTKHQYRKSIVANISSKQTANIHINHIKFPK